MSRYSVAPRGATGQVILTRQGISLELLPPTSGGGQRVLACTRAAPACRHADGTISSSSVLDVRRMASEDSEEVGPGLLAVHRLSDVGDRGQPLEREVLTGVDHLIADSVAAPTTSAALADEAN
jgi:hypothetical protein